MDHMFSTGNRWRFLSYWTDAWAVPYIHWLEITEYNFSCDAYLVLFLTAFCFCCYCCLFICLFVFVLRNIHARMIFVLSFQWKWSHLLPFLCTCAYMYGMSGTVPKQSTVDEVTAYVRFECTNWAFETALSPGYFCYRFYWYIFIK